MSPKAVVAKSKDTPEVKMIVGIDMAETSRRAWLVGLGAVAMAQDEIINFANRLVERGSITEKEARKLTEQTWARAMQWQRDSMKSAESELDRQVDALLAWLGVPTKADIERMDLPSRADIEALSEKVGALARKVEQLRKTEEQQTQEIAAVRKTEEKQNQAIAAVRKTEEQQAEEIAAVRKAEEKQSRKIEQVRKVAEEKPAAPARKAANEKPAEPARKTAEEKPAEPVKA